MEAENADFINMAKGQEFEAIVYHGADPVVAESIFKFLGGSMERQMPIPLNGLDRSIKVLKIEAGEDLVNRKYFVKLKGEIV